MKNALEIIKSAVTK